MAQQVALQAVPAQQVQAVLGTQQCQISVYVKTQCMFFDLNANGTQIAYAVQAKNLVNLVPTSYLGFTGWLTFFDTQGTDDPQYTGLGSRWVLLYLTAEDFATYGIPYAA